MKSKQPSLSQLIELYDSEDIFKKSLFELWRGNDIFSSIKSARLSREKADSILDKLFECGAIDENGMPV